MYSNQYFLTNQVNQESGLLHSGEKVFPGHWHGYANCSQCSGLQYPHWGFLIETKRDLNAGDCVGPCCSIYNISENGQFILDISTTTWTRIGNQRRYNCLFMHVSRIALHVRLFLRFRFLKHFHHPDHDGLCLDWLQEEVKTEWRLLCSPGRL